MKDQEGHPKEFAFARKQKREKKNNKRTTTTRDPKDVSKSWTSVSG
jgi:hypothetical protein